jgi:hypothetical protein
MENIYNAGEDERSDKKWSQPFQGIECLFLFIVLDWKLQQKGLPRSRFLFLREVRGRRTGTWGVLDHIERGCLYELYGVRGKSSIVIFLDLLQVPGRAIASQESA